MPWVRPDDADSRSGVSPLRWQPSRGRTRLALGAGWGTYGSEDYALFSAGLGYFLLNGLEAGLDGEAWVGSSPQIYKLTPGLRYVFSYRDRLLPYIGAFYRRVFFSDDPSVDSVGGRAGASAGVIA